MRFAWLVVVPLLTMGASPQTHQGELLFPGANWETNVKTRTGDRWLALRNDSGISTLVWARVHVAKNPRPGDRPILVTVDGGYSPVFLLRGVPRLSPGPTRTMFDGETSLDWNHGATFRDVGPKQQFVFVGGTPAHTTQLQERKLESGYHLVLTSHMERVSQNIFVCAVKPYMTPKLRWAGDLDHDGRLDLIVDVQTREAGGSTYQLWLSSLAKRGELVGLAATLRDPAC